MTVNNQVAVVWMYGGSDRRMASGMPNACCQPTLVQAGPENYAVMVMRVVALNSSISSCNCSISDWYAATKRSTSSRVIVAT